MNNWQGSLLTAETPLRKAIELINDNDYQIALIVDKENRLIGTVTDGDVRRAILHNVPMRSPVKNTMCKNYTKADIHDTDESIVALMQSKYLRHMPVVDEQGRVVALKSLFQLFKAPLLENSVLIMAGGLGRRLKPLTDDCPKPLLNVGGKPLLKTIIENIREYGLKKFYISLNYKAEMVESYFGDGSKMGIEIKYLRETKQLGTAGALSLLGESLSSPLIVMNCDLLTKVNFSQLLDYHTKNNDEATVCVKEYDFEIPYGVVKIDQHRVVELEEKPVQRFFVNAGIYVLEPSTLEYIPKNEFFDMPTLFSKMLERNKNVGVFPIHEYWIDIGKIDDFEQANGDYTKHFGIESTRRQNDSA